MNDFGQLRAIRRELRTFCAQHLSALRFFDAEPSFRLHADEGELDRRVLRHLTSTATCLESLGHLPELSTDLRLASRNLNFATAALARPPKDWTSDSSAAIYCRCRALPLVITSLPAYDTVLDEHLNTILEQLTVDRFAIGEADPSDDPTNWYPPNAFHTHWTLLVLAILRARFPDPQREARVEPARQGMLLWLRKLLAVQIALHHCKSAALDTDQLIWALSSLLRFDRPSISAGDQDLYSAAVEAIFSTQLDIGTWPTFRPLFHYHKSGNAYCYIFESLAVLLRAAVTPEAIFIRTQLWPFRDRLVALARYADSTAIRLPTSGEPAAWCSGHRANLTAAESWATASVYSFAQGLRRLIGSWTREVALKDLNLVALVKSVAEAESDIRDRGETWSKPSVSRDLFCLFVNPVRLAKKDDPGDIDHVPIPKGHSRSAILYGPPGTSKTTLVRAMAAAIGWDFVEIHASHFVADGLPNVQRRADEIFSRLMELDRAVVFFDEIDELIRERDDKAADAFGRFLTTSMLPKLGDLWQARRILYFVATNHVGFFDAAILRGQRFDAVIAVPPPSLRSKMEALGKLIATRTGHVGPIELEVHQEKCEDALLQAGQSEGGDLPVQLMLAKLVLLRWDQLDELAYLISQQGRPESGTDAWKIGSSVVEAALAKVKDVRLARRKTYWEYANEKSYERRDYGKVRAWRVSDVSSFEGLPDCLRPSGDANCAWLVGYAESPEDLSTNEFRFEEGAVSGEAVLIPHQSHSDPIPK